MLSRTIGRLNHFAGVGKMIHQLGGVNPRLLVAALSLSAAGFIGLVVHEGYTDRAVIPTAGDVPTVGFGSTVHEDGSRVKLGDTTTPTRALVKARAHIGREEERFRASLPGVAMTQAEYDLYMDFVYQFGIKNWVGSSMQKALLAGNYRAACDGLLEYRFQGKGAQRRDCALPSSWGPRGCKGVWLRQQERHTQCLAAVEAAGD